LALLIKSYAISQKLFKLGRIFGATCSEVHSHDVVSGSFQALACHFIRMRFPENSHTAYSKLFLGL
jgi:hypothetical protein